jgi:hypothetical protein
MSKYVAFASDAGFGTEIRGLPILALWRRRVGALGVRRTTRSLRFRGFTHNELEGVFGDLGACLLDQISVVS